MKPLWIKLGVLLWLWYEIAAELSLAGRTTMALALLASAGSMMLPHLPGRLSATPRILLIAGPAAVWFGLVWWLTPSTAGGFPILALLLAALLVIAGAGARYVAARYPQWLAPHYAMLRGLIMPAGTILMALAGAQGLLALAVTGMLIALPMTLGWRVIGLALEAPGAKHG